MCLLKQNAFKNKSLSLKFCSWNIHGFNSRQLGNKLIDREFLDTIDKVGFLGITETHIHDGILDKLNIPGT